MTNQLLENVDEYPLLNCTNCGTPNPTTQQQGNFIDDGLDIDINTLGYYGGFTDNFPPKEGNTTAHLCHDCCVLLFNALPGFAKFADMTGGHGNIIKRDLDIANGTLIKPCCPYAWTWDATDPKNIITYISTPELTWKKIEHEEDHDEYE